MLFRSPQFYQPDYEKTECIPCGPRRYQELEGQIDCEDCLDHCEWCDTGTNCFSCTYPYFRQEIPVTNEIKCLEICIENFFGNSTSRECERILFFNYSMFIRLQILSQ